MSAPKNRGACLPRTIAILHACILRARDLPQHVSEVSDILEGRCHQCIELLCHLVCYEYERGAGVDGLDAGVSLNSKSRSEVIHTAVSASGAV